MLNSSNNMSLQQKLNWYVEYDYKTFNILHDPKFRTLIYKEVQQFAGMEGPIPRHQQVSVGTPEWIQQIAEAIREILTLLYNFFNVEYKLSKDQKVKASFKTICSLLKIESEYSKFFFTMSLQFRINRILASTLRLNKIMNSIVEEISNLKKNMDQTLLDNLDEVYLFMHQRIVQTLEVSKQQQDHDLNVILLDNISLLMRNSGDPTMKGVLDVKREKKIIDKVLKSNQVYNKYMMRKVIQQRNFEDHKEFEIQMPIQQDPNAKRQRRDSQQDEQSFG